MDAFIETLLDMDNSYWRTQFDGSELGWFKLAMELKFKEWSK